MDKIRVLILLLILTYVYYYMSRPDYNNCYFESDVKYIVLENPSYDTNCGDEIVKITDQFNLDEYCHEFMKLEEINIFTSVSINYWSVYIKVSDSKWSNDMLALVNNKSSGYIFIGGIHKYRNDKLARMVINHLDIHRINNPCN